MRADQQQQQGKPFHLQQETFHDLNGENGHVVEAGDVKVSPFFPFSMPLQRAPLFTSCPPPPSSPS